MKRSERERIAAEKSVERERLAAEKSVGREQMRQEKYWADARAKSRAADRAERETTLSNHKATVRSVAGGVGNSVRSAVGTIAGIGGTVLGVAGLAGAGEAVSQEIDIDRRVRQTVVNARGAGETGADPRAIRNQIRDVAKSTGVSESGLTGGVEAYVTKTGDIKAAMSNLQSFATVSMATGAAVEDISSSAADMAKLGITNIDDMTQALATLTMQGKKGSFEIRDMAQQFPEVLANAAKNGIRGLSGLTQLGGLMQIVQHSTGNASETTTALNQMSNQLVAKQGDLASGKALGGRKVNVFTDKTNHTMRDQRDIIGDVLEGSRGDIAKLNDLFEIRGSKAFSGFTTAYNTKYDSAKRGGATDKDASAQGRAAAMALLDDAAKVAGTWSDIQRDAAEVAKSDAVKLEKINTQLREAFATKLLPALERLMPKFEELIPQIAKVTGAFADFIGWFVSNPVKGLGYLVLGKIGEDLAAAGIGAGAKAAMEAAIAKSLASGISVGRLAATATTATLAISALTLAWGEADDLGKKAGVKSRATDVLVPGKSGGKFSWGQAAEDVAGLISNPLGYLGDKGGGIAGDYAQGIWHTANDGTPMAKPLSPEEYKEKYGGKGAPSGPAQQQAATLAAAEATTKAAADMSAAAKEISAAAKVASGNPARNNPIVNRN